MAYGKSEIATANLNTISGTDVGSDRSRCLWPILSLGRGSAKFKYHALANSKPKCQMPNGKRRMPNGKCSAKCKMALPNHGKVNANANAKSETQQRFVSSSSSRRLVSWLENKSPFYGLLIYDVISCLYRGFLLDVKGSRQRQRAKSTASDRAINANADSPTWKTESKGWLQLEVCIQI